MSCCRVGIVSCTNVKSYCAAYVNGQQYSCPGHQNRVSSSSSPKYSGQTPPFSSYQAYSGSGSYTNANIVKAIDINTLRDNLASEINLRKNHSLYTSSSIGSLGSNIDVGQVVDHVQQNLVVDIIAQLANVINSVPAKAGDGTKTAPSAEMKTAIGDLIEARNLKGLEELLAPILNDCICYSDCTDHKKTLCSCYGNCGCVYS